MAARPVQRPRGRSAGRCLSLFLPFPCHKTHFCLLCFGSLPLAQPPSRLCRPTTQLSPCPSATDTHLLQRPWVRHALPPTDLGREHFWHMHSFPLKVTRSPGGNGTLKQESALAARPPSAVLLAGSPPRWPATASPRTHGDKCHLSIRALVHPCCATSGRSLTT